MPTVREFVAEALGVGPQAADEFLGVLDSVGLVVVVKGCKELKHGDVVTSRQIVRGS